MTRRWLLLILVTSLLCATCSGDNECSAAMSNSTEIVVTCLPSMTYEELPLYNYTTDQLANITSIVVNGLNSSSPGPFTSIPPNICLLPNLRSVDFSNNLLRNVDPADALRDCFADVLNLDVSYNNITEFPSATIYNMQNLQNLYFQHNQLIEVPGYAFYDLANIDRLDFSYNRLTAFELWALLVKRSADFRFNQITMITNKYFFDFRRSQPSSDPKVISLNGNPSVNFTDAIYEMYYSCNDVINQLELIGPTDQSIEPTFSLYLAAIDFGTITINCSCEQSYILQTMGNSFGGLNDSTWLPIYNATCTDGTKFVFSQCDSGESPPNSSVDFARVYPRLCKIQPDEPGSVTDGMNITAPTANAPPYPHYETELMSPGACFFAFSAATAVRIKCTSDTSNASAIPSGLLSSAYLASVTSIDFARRVTSLPSYLCSLPSREIDLSYQSFTTLTDEIFPCLDWFRTVRMTYNQLTSVNMRSGNFANLTVLDLSSNRLSTLPHSILTPSPTSLRLLNLSNNSITSIDLFLYTLKNITVDLSNNPIVNATVINPQNVTLPSGNNTNSSVTIVLPPAVANSTYVFNDQAVLNAGTCNRNAVLAYRNTLQSLFSAVLLDCSCASVNLKVIFERSNAEILDDFTCLNPTTATNYSRLTLSACGTNALDFSTGLCYNESLQWTTTTTTTTSTTTTSTTSLTTTTSTTTTSTTSVTTTTSTTSVTTTTSTTTTSVTTTTSTTATTTTTVTNTTTGVLQSSEGSVDAGRTGLIVGLVLGLVAFLALVGGLIAAVCILKARSVSHAAAKSTMVSQAAATGQAPRDTLLQSHLQTRNSRATRLAPLNTQPTHLPPLYTGSTALTASATNPALNRSNLRASIRGIPLRLEPIRPPMNVAAPYATNLYSANDRSLSMGEDVRY